MTTSISRDMARQIMHEVQEALKPLAEERRLNVEVKRGSFEPRFIRLTVELAVVRDDGTVESKERIAYKNHCRLYGLKPEWLGQRFLYNGDLFEVIGLNTRARTMPVLVKRVTTGKNYKMPPVLVKGAFERQGEVLPHAPLSE